MNISCIIVIPCYNEERRFPLDGFRAFAQAHPHIHFLLVNDGSRDNTVAMLRQARQGLEDRVEVLDQKVNRGKAEAVRVGMLAAMARTGCEVAGFWDADMAAPLDQIEDLAGILAGNPETVMVFGSRVKLLGRNIQRRAIRHYLGRMFATAVSVVLRLAVYDTQCGAKLFRVTGETRRLFAEAFGSRWVFDVEIVARFIQVRCYDIASVERAIYEYPLPVWRDVAGSQVKPTDFLRAFFEVLAVHRRYGGQVQR